LIYSFARDQNYFIGAHAVDSSLLKKIQVLTEDLEVSRRTLVEWQRAILEGYKVRAQLVKNRGGYVIVDMDNKTIEFRKKRPK